jgi:hypothetical protein
MSRPADVNEPRYSIFFRTPSAGGRGKFAAAAGPSILFFDSSIASLGMFAPRLLDPSFGCSPIVLLRALELPALPLQFLLAVDSPVSMSAETQGDPLRFKDAGR